MGSTSRVMNSYNAILYPQCEYLIYLKKMDCIRTSVDTVGRKKQNSTPSEEVQETLDDTHTAVSHATPKFNTESSLNEP